jgi:uncharacterized membrane protein
MKRKIIEAHIENQTTLSDRISDIVTDFVGSWKFLLFQTVVFILWVSVNIYFASKPFDPYPFIFLNLIMALETVYTTPLIMMSQNRQETRDRVRDDADFEADINAEKNIELVRKEIEELKREIETYIVEMKNNSR